MHWMLLPLRRYADFQGRSGRMEYWMFTMGFSLLAVLLTIPFFIFTDASGNLTLGAGSFLLVTFLGLFYLAIFIPSVAVQVRRLHDRDKSGWFILMGFIPYIGGLILLVFMLLEGTRGPNRFGPDPKNPEADLESVFR